MLYSLMLIAHAKTLDWKEGLITKPLSKEHCESQFEVCSCSAVQNSCVPEYSATISAISDELKTKMLGKSFHENCPVPFENLSTIQLMHWTPEGEIYWGHITVAAVQAENVAAIFGELYAAQFPIASMKLIHEFNGSDDSSMRANNTSGFNCRPIKNTNRWSQHSYGQAIDVNPLWNPWVLGRRVDPPEGKAFIDREKSLPGMIHAGDATVQSFQKYGWKWGGYWQKTKDYQHFSANGR